MFTVDTKVPVLDGALTLAIKIWYPPSVTPATAAAARTRCSLSYPGWLDNVGSFENIAPLLCEQLDMVIGVIDPPGCGWSDHRSQESVYSDFEEPVLVGDVADALGWQNFGLISHSRGAAISAFAAALFPSRVLFLIAFDSNLGLSGVWMRDLKPGAPTPVQRMRLAREQLRKNRVRHEKVFATLDDAIKANSDNEIFKKSRSTAQNIVMRHIRPHPSGGFTFIHDVRTYGNTSQFVVMTEEQTRVFLREIKCPVLRISTKPEAERYSEEYREYFESRTRCIPDFEEVIVPGGHHVHSDNAPAVAQAANVWLAKRRLISQGPHVSPAKSLTPKL